MNTQPFNNEIISQVLVETPAQIEIRGQKMSAMQSVFERIEVIAGPESGDKERLAAATKLLNEVRTREYIDAQNLAMSPEMARQKVYREEQSLAKLVEYYTLEVQAALLENEINGIVPGTVGKNKAEKPESISADGKYLLH
jgi:hypothetical protein